jgi:hypothetical protein
MSLRVETLGGLWLRGPFCNTLTMIRVRSATRMAAGRGRKDRQTKGMHGSMSRTPRSITTRTVGAWYGSKRGLGSQNVYVA